MGTKSCGVSTNDFLSNYEITLLLGEGKIKEKEAVKNTIKTFVDEKLDGEVNTPASRDMVMRGVITALNELDASGDITNDIALVGTTYLTEYVNSKEEPEDFSSDNGNTNNLDDVIINDIASLSTNIESTIIEKGTLLKDYPPFIESGIKKVSTRVFYNLYFRGIGGNVKYFRAFTNSHVREILMGTTLEEGQEISSITGPTADMSAKYNVLKERLRASSSGISGVSKEEILTKFKEKDHDFMNKYYSYVMLANLEFLIEGIAEGNKVSMDKDLKGTKDEHKKYASPSPKVTIKKEYVNDFENFARENLDELVFNLDDSTIDEKKLFVKRMSVVDTVKDGEATKEYVPFVKFSGVPTGFTTKRFNINFPNLLMEDDSSKINTIKNGDIFLSKIDPKTGRRLMVRASPEYMITYNLTDKAKRGHEEDFNGFDNDTTFIKFLLKSTTRLLAADENGVFTQDPDKPYLSDIDFYKISAELSNIEDRTSTGIQEFLSKKIKERANSNESVDVIYRSIYYAYFSNNQDSVYSYTPIGRKTPVKMVSLGVVAKMKKLQFTSKTGAPNMISALVQFLSKQGVGRIQFKQGKLVEFSIAEMASLEIGIPDNIANSVLSNGNLNKYVKNNISTQVKGNKIEITTKYGNYGESIVTTIFRNSQKEIKFISDKIITDYDSINKIFKSLNLPPKLRNPKFITKLVSATVIESNENNSTSKKITDIIGAITTMAALKDADTGSIIDNIESTDDTDNTEIVGIKNEILEKSPQAILRPYIGKLTEIYEEIWGTGAPNYGINSEGNKFARYTNSDREGQMIYVRKQQKNPYSMYGVNSYVANDDIYDGNALDDGLVNSAYSISQKDGIEQDMESYTNQSMTVKMRMSQAIDGGFYEKLAGYEHNTFFVQPMVYSDRSSINMYKFTLSSDIELDGLGRDEGRSNFLADKSPNTWNKLKQNYINVFRNKYNNMQYNVYRNWTDFLLSSELETLLAGVEGKKSKVDLASARALGYKMANVTREELNGKHAFKWLAREIADLGIPMNLALKSSYLSEGVIASSMNTAGLKGKLFRHNKIAVPTLTASLMTEYLHDDASAIKFLNENIKNSINTLKHTDIQYTRFTQETVGNMESVFGRELSFDEGIKLYHLVTAPVSDSILDTLMSPDTEYGSNGMTAKMIEKTVLPKVGKNGKLIGGSYEKLSSSSFLDMLAERTRNFIIQSKRVQSMGSKGIRPRLFRSEGYYRENLPKQDIYFGITDEKKRILLEAPDASKFNIAFTAGVFTKINGKTVINGEVPITIAGSINFIKPGTNPGEWVFSRVVSEYQDDPELFDDVLNSINELKIPFPEKVRSNLIGTFGVDYEYNKASEDNTFYAIQHKLDNDDGEVGLGMEDVSKNILINEDEVGGKAHLLGSLGITDEQDSLDGVQWAHPLYFLKLNGSLGEEFSSFSTNGAGVKDLSQYIDRKTGILKLQKKSTQNIFTNEILSTVGNKKLHAIFKKMNTAEIFPAGYSLQYPVIINGAERTGEFKAKFFKSKKDIEAFVQKMAMENNMTFDELIYEVAPEWDTMTDSIPTGTIMTVDGKLQEFHNLQELWENQGSYYQNDSWEKVSKILANNPKVRNTYIEKLGFNSAQKTGNSNLNGSNVLLDENLPASEISTYDLNNESHIVMLQKEHDFDSSDGADHPSKLALPSQFISALFFEGKTMSQAMNSLKGISTITNNKIKLFYMGIAKALKSEKDLAFLALEENIVLPDGSTVKFSDLNFSDITPEVIEAFDEMLMDVNNIEFKDKLYKKMALDKIKKQIREDRDSVIILNLAGKDVDTVSFNSMVLREKAVNVFRSGVHGEIISSKLPGVIAITAPSDFMTSMENTSQGRMARMDAIKFTFESTNYNDVKNVKKVKSLDEFLAIDLIPTDKVRISKKDGSHYYQYAGLIKTLEGDSTIEYVEFQERNENIYEEYNIDVEAYLMNPLTVAGVMPEDMEGNAAIDISMANTANKFIGTKAGDAPISSTEKYMYAWGNKANTGNYTSSDIIMVSGSGPWRGVTNAQINHSFRKNTRPLLDKAIDAGASFVLGNAEGTDAIVAKYLQGKGYILKPNPDGFLQAINPDIKKELHRFNKLQVTNIARKYNEASTTLTLNEFVNRELKAKMNNDPTINKINEINKIPFMQLEDMPIFSNLGINVMRKSDSHHFGNPATGSNIAGLIQMNNGSTRENVRAAAMFYKNWLKGEQDPNYSGDILKVEPQRREWILKQIQDGKLANQPLLYMKTTLDYINATGSSNYYSHADALAEFIKETEDVKKAETEKNIDDEFEKNISDFDTYKKKKSPELRRIVDEYSEIKKSFQKDSNKPTKLTGRDWVEDIHTGEVVPSFYAKLLHGDLSMFKLYTKTDTDLNWYKYNEINPDGTKTVFEDSKIFQRNYILNKNKKLYQKLYPTTYKLTDKLYLKLKQRTLGEMQTYMEKNNIEVILPEAYAPNFFMKSFDMTEEDLLSDVIGFSENTEEQVAHAKEYFKNKMYGISRFNVNTITDITEKNIQDRLLKYKKLIIKENNGSKIRIYKDIVLTIEEELKLTGGVVTVTTGKELTKKVNSVIKKGNGVQINRNSQKRAISFVKALEVMPPRIPGQGKQSGAVMKIKAFINSNKNAFYAPREFYLNSGEDNDIDTNNVITRAIDENGYEYSYNKYVLIPEEVLSENGYKKKYRGTMHNFPIMSPNGTNKVMDEELVELEKSIREEIKNFNNFAKEEEKISEDEINNIISKKISNKMKSFEKVIQNYIIDNMKAIMSDPKNMIELETPISMEKIKAVARSINENTNKGYDYSKHGITSFNSAWIGILEELNMQGKTGISAYANGQRTLAAILAVQSNNGKPLKIGNPLWEDVNGSGQFENNTSGDPIGLTITIKSKIEERGDNESHEDYTKRVEKATRRVTRREYANTESNGESIVLGEYTPLHTLDNIPSKDLKKFLAANEVLNSNMKKASFEGQYKAWEIMSQLLSAATDNAKALLLGKIGANNDTNTLITTMLTLGFSLDDVTDFLGDPEMKALFKEFNSKRNNFEMAHLSSFLKNKVFRKTNSRFEKEVLFLLEAGEDMDKFRRVLTFAQDNKIETRDLYKALSAVYSSSVGRSFIAGKVSGMSINEAFTEKKNNLYDDKNPISNKNPKTFLTTKVFNPLFFIQNHDHSKAILKGINTAEQAIRAISPIDKIISDKIRRDKKVLPTDQHNNLEKYINNLLIDEYMSDKKAYIPTRFGQETLDLSIASNREKLVYGMHESVTYVREKLAQAGISNVFLDSIEFMKSKEDSLKTVIGIPSLMDEEDSNKIVLELDIEELKYLDDPKLRAISINLIDALFKYSIITNKGKESRNSIVSVFELEYDEFSDALGEIDIKKKISKFISNSKHEVALKLAIGKFDNIKYLPEDKSSIVVNEFGVKSKEEKRDNALLNPLTETKERKGKLIKVTHPKLNDYSYISRTINVVDKDSGDDKIMLIKVFKKYNNETLPVNISKDDEELSGYSIGLDAKISPSETGKVTVYLGNGLYLAETKSGEDRTVYDSVLEELNPDLVFFGNDFRKATEYDKKLSSRSFDFFNFEGGESKNSANTIIKSNNNVILVTRSDGTSYTHNETKARHELLDFIFDPRNNSHSVVSVREEIEKQADIINRRVVMEADDKGTENDIKLWIKLSDSEITNKKIIYRNVPLKNTWGNGDIKEMALDARNLEEIVSEYMAARKIDASETSNVTKRFNIFFSNFTKKEFISTELLSIQSNMEKINEVFTEIVSGPFELLNEDLQQIKKCRI